MGEKLETPTDILCPLCRDEKATVKENKGGKPSVFCNSLNTCINFRGDDPWGFVAEFQDGEPPATELTEPDETDEPDDGPKTIEELLSDNG